MGPPVHSSFEERAAYAEVRSARRSGQEGVSPYGHGFRAPQTPEFNKVNDLELVSNMFYFYF